MIRFVFFTTALLFLVFTQNSRAQTLTSQEERDLREELKMLKKDPYRFQQMKKEDATLDLQLRNKEAELTKQVFILDERNEEAFMKDTLIESLREKRLALEKPNSTIKYTSSATGQSQEIYFRVQIGAYKNKKLVKKLEKAYNLVLEERNGFTKFMIGQFSSYWEAKNLSKFLNKSGAQAYVVGYKDDVRVPDLKDLPEALF